MLLSNAVAEVHFEPALAKYFSETVLNQRISAPAYVSGGHSTQLLIVELPTTSENLPAAHSVQLSKPAAPAKRPGGHAMQPVLASVPCVPGAHGVQMPALAPEY